MARQSNPVRRQGKRPEESDGQTDLAASMPVSAKVKQTYVKQSDVPSGSLDEALRIPRAIGDHYAFHPTRPFDVAAALNMQPASSQFRMLVGASIAYGLTEGGYNAEFIAVQPLAIRILKPKEEGDDTRARREALLKPRVLREFLEKFKGNKLPREDIARNVLLSLGVPQEATERTIKLITDSARALGILRAINGVEYVDMSEGTDRVRDVGSVPNPEDSESAMYDESDAESNVSLLRPLGGSERTTAPENRRVFITHGKNKAFIDPLKELLAFGELEPVVSVERESVSQPVPDKVMNDMRSCSAAIIHVDAEERLLDPDGNVRVVHNPNVLIEIGADMALYGRRFILLVKQGIQLPSNLQGLYEVRYDGEKLDGESTIKLLKAMKDIKNHPLPGTQ